jgi:hypothetical protein
MPSTPTGKTIAFRWPRASTRASAAARTRERPRGGGRALRRADRRGGAGAAVPAARELLERLRERGHAVVLSETPPRPMERGSRIIQDWVRMRTGSTLRVPTGTDC